MTILAQLFGHPADSVAAIVGRRRVTYGEFCSDVDRAVCYLGEQGLGPDSIVGIFLGGFRQSNDYSSWVAHLAAIRIGATHATIHGGRSLTDVLSLAPLDAVIGTLPANVPAPGSRVVPFDLVSMPSGSTRGDEESAARLNLTSGTTGAPKIIRWDHDMIAARIDQVLDLDLINAQTKLDCYLAPRTTAGFRYPLATWRAGGAVLLSDGSGDQAIDANDSNLCVCSPFQLQVLRSARVRWANPPARTIVSLGGRLSPGLRDYALANLAGTTLISYGSTETGNVAHGDAKLTDRDPGAVGWIRDGVEVQIVDSNGTEVENGTTGLIRLRSPAMARAGGATAKADEWFEPGDLAVLYEDGLLAIQGRASDVLNVGGLKFSAVGVETRIAGIEGIEDAAIAVVPASNGDMIVAAVVTRGGRAAGNFLDSVKPLLPRGCPFRLIGIDSIPRNAMGKVDRPKLLDRLRQVYEAALRVQRQHA